MKLVSDKLFSLFLFKFQQHEKTKVNKQTVGKRHHYNGTSSLKCPTITIFHASTGQMIFGINMSATQWIHVILNWYNMNPKSLFPLRNMYWRHDMMIFKLVWEVVTGDGCRGGSAWVCTEGCLSPLWASSQAEAREEYLTTSLKVSALRN